MLEDKYVAYNDNTSYFIDNINHKMFGVVSRYLVLGIKQKTNDRKVNSNTGSQMTVYHTVGFRSPF